MVKITKDSKIGDITRTHPDVVALLFEAGLHCVGCHVSHSESLEEGCLAHGMSEKDVKELVEKINKVLAKQPNFKKKTVKDDL
ncbi:DUF1858 domain-containing protein [Candidatus Woesearchaeota archaeon]|nr:DUF1858 domain-containing protein [Candidatus Woesearchaeota archaeon]